MAKKRVHEIAKEKGISSKEVLAILQKAGFNVKAAASSVDEDDIVRAFSGGTAGDDAPAEPADGAKAPAPSSGSDGAPERSRQLPGRATAPAVTPSAIARVPPARHAVARPAVAEVVVAGAW